MAHQLTKRELWAVVLLGFISLFLFADQNLLAPNLTQIADEFGFTELERDQKLGGDIALVFWLLGGVITLAIGVMTDRLPRKSLFVAVVLIGELPCLLTGFARTYDELFWLRALTGIGIGGALPIVYSLLGDFFSARNRTTAVAVIGFAMGVGIALGQLIAGFVGPTHGWRLPFILVAAPNFFLGVLFWLTVREPARGQTEEELKDVVDDGHAYTARISVKEYLQIFRIPTNALIFLQGIPGTVPWGVFFVFLNDFYAVDKGYSVQVATLIVMALGVAAIFGGLAGGLAGQWLYNKNPRWLPLLCGVATLIGIIPTLLLLNYPTQAGVESPDPTVPILLGLATGFTVTITSANVRAILLNVNAPETRGSVFSLFNLADDLGKGLGPAIIGLLIAAYGRVGAFNASTGFWIFCGITLIAVAWTFPRDEEKLRQRLTAASAEPPAA